MRTRKRFGQHFLEPVWADKLVEAIKPSPDDVVLEIGAGPGILTLRLAPRVSRLIAVEIDRDLVRHLTPRLPANASIVSGDVLDVDLEALLTSAAPGARVRVVGNLPYNISSPILFRVLDLTKHRPVKDGTFMLQREVADRVAARPGSADYGVLSFLVQWHADVSKVLALPPGAFRPPPAVHSSVIRLAFRPAPTPVVDEGLFEAMVRRMFMQRRKTIANSLASFADELGVSPSDALQRAGIDPARRPGTLEIVEIARLADVFAAGRR